MNPDYALLFNIGLNVPSDNAGPSKTSFTLNPDFVIGIVYAHELRPVAQVVHRSNTESTLVLAFDQRALALGDSLRYRVHSIAEMLQQDCIAVYWPEADAGALIGPRADTWGDFNKRFFLNLDGTCLAK